MNERQPERRVDDRRQVIRRDDDLIAAHRKAEHLFTRHDNCPACQFAQEAERALAIVNAGPIWDQPKGAPDAR